MKAYSKPVAELENFSLDNEFASGGCSVIPQEQKDKYYGTFQGNLDNVLLELEEYNLGFADGSEWLKPIANYNGLTFGELIALDTSGAEFISAVDNYTMYLINTSQDDLNSGFCYFTYNAGEGKSFS